MAPIITNPFRFAAAGGAPHWQELGRTTLGSDADDITVTGFASKPYLMILNHNIKGSVATGNGIRLGTSSTIDTGSNYSHRRSNDGGTDTTTINTDGIYHLSSSGGDTFGVTYVNNISSKEKLLIGHETDTLTGATVAPNRWEYTGKWANTSDSVGSVEVKRHTAGTNQMGSGSEVVVLGYDPADTGTSVWEELDSVELTSTTDSLDTNTFTAKKYLWVQAYTTIGSGTPEFRMKFSGDTSSNYASRYTQGGAGDSTSTSSSNGIIGVSAIPQNTLTNMFIINKSDKEKLVIMEAVNQNTAGAGTAPNREECVGKFANTSSQITSIEVASGIGGDWGSGSSIKVWGFN